MVVLLLQGMVPTQHDVLPALRSKNGEWNMENEIVLIPGKDGKFHEYSDKFDITIHCRNQEEQDMAIQLLVEKDNNSGWHRVEDELPPYCSYKNRTRSPDVAVYCGSGGRYGAYYEGANWYLSSTNSPIYGVTHWMYWPKGPELEEKA